MLCFYLLGLSLKHDSPTTSEQLRTDFILYIHKAYEQGIIQSFTILQTCLRLECYYTSKTALHYFFKNTYALESYEAIRYVL
ncbi:MAG: hypothetical protein ACRC5H_09160, partial [Treponemataceae bacterium]